MNYWWASQGRNYKTAIPNGTLWTSPWPDGTLRKDRIQIKDIRNGDIVFHYARRQVRAVSRVIAENAPLAAHRLCKFRPLAARRAARATAEAHRASVRRSRL